MDCGQNRQLRRVSTRGALVGVICPLAGPRRAQIFVETSSWVLVGGMNYWLCGLGKANGPPSCGWE